MGCMNSSQCETETNIQWNINAIRI